MAISTSPMDGMLTSCITAWFVIGTTRINNKLEDCTVAVQTSVVCRCVPRLIVTPQYLSTVRFYKGLNWNQQPTSHGNITHNISVRLIQC